MTVTLIVSTAINQVALVNDTLVSARRRGFDGTVTLPTRRERAKAAVYENSLLKMDASVQTTQTGEFTP